ncbi:SseB family protein [Campylobacter sp. RM16187]|uniref:SseB family protein n=1 Tax=Campylobacter sp. RM16187 TaxID=1660063 RepID=UPI0021B66930|nr:SseB family protein [Campylobacter sp. RM16187]QKG28921.1 putative SseB domain protein [Campylobacter sp. RM16187]
MSINLTKTMQNFLDNPNNKNENTLINELRKAEFIAPVIINQALAKPDGKAVYEEEGSNIKFILLEDEESDLGYFPAFTSKEEMMKWRNDSEQEILNLELKNYLAMLESSKEKYAGIVIDAFSHSFILSTATLKKICEI